MTTTGKVECVDGGPAHAWSSGGLATNSRSQLVTIRRCLSCHTEEEKRYGAGGTVPWRPAATPAPRLLRPLRHLSSSTTTPPVSPPTIGGPMTLAESLSTSRGWWDRAACRDIDTDIFFPDGHGNDVREAMAVCDRCPVQEECLEANLGQKHGIFGGTTERQRRRIRRARKMAHSNTQGGD